MSMGWPRFWFSFLYFYVIPYFFFVFLAAVRIQRTKAISFYSLSPYCSSHRTTFSSLGIFFEWLIVWWLLELFLLSVPVSLPHLLRPTICVLSLFSFRNSVAYLVFCANGISFLPLVIIFSCLLTHVVISFYFRVSMSQQLSYPISILSTIPLFKLLVELLLFVFGENMYVENFCC